jgi:protein phosphatase 1 regulatory subunit 7
MEFQHIEGLDALVNLEELWLGKNKLTKLEVQCIASSWFWCSKSYDTTESEYTEQTENIVSSV